MITVFLSAWLLGGAVLALVVGGAARMADARDQLPGAGAVHRAPARTEVPEPAAA